MDFNDDLEVLETAIFETDQRIRKLEKHKEAVKKDLKDDKSDNKNIVETLRRLEHNLDDLYNKRIFLIKERDAKLIS